MIKYPAPPNQQTSQTAYQSMVGFVLAKMAYLEPQERAINLIPHMNVPA